MHAALYATIMSLVNDNV